MTASEQDLNESVRSGLRAIVSPEASIEQLEIRTTRVLDALTGEEVSHLIIRLDSSHPTLALGLFDPFSTESEVGFSLPFIRGWLCGYLERQGADVSPFEVHLDVGQDSPPGLAQNPSRDIALLDAFDANLVQRDSPLAEACKREGIDRILVSGGVVSGPSVGMINVLAEELDSQASGSAVFDLFAGSCALSRVALNHGARPVTAIDVLPETQLDAASSWSEDFNYVRSDVGEALSRLQSALGIVVADPYYGRALGFIRVLSGLENIPEKLVLNGGRSVLEHHQFRVRSALTQLEYRIRSYDYFGESIYVCSRM